MKGKIIFVLFVVLLASCREDVMIFSPEEEQHGHAQNTKIVGFYLLNEGNMGSNKSTLDFYDYSTAMYSRNIFAEANPTVPKELGDVGNDIQIYGSRLYAVINCSNKIEVMDAKTCKKIGQVDIPNCRYIRFDKQYAYVTSYAGPVSFDPELEQIGYVAKFDTATLEIVAQCLVGYQPDELAIANDKIYVANSGGYRFPNYENTVSVIDLNTFTEQKRIEVAINLHRVRMDNHGQLWVASRGDYYDVSSKLYCIDTQTDEVVDSVEIAVSNMDIVGDSLYACATEWSYNEMNNTIAYGIVNTKTHEIVSSNFITDGTEQKIKIPYGIKVNPETREIFVTDAKDYVSPGTLYCFSPEGKKRWEVRTGDIPAHIVFLKK